MDIVQLTPGTKLASIVKLVSKKRKAILAKPKTAVPISGTYWDGGSRSDWFLINLASMKAVPLAHQNPPQFGGPKEDPIQPLEPGYALICAGVFCGKPATPVVYFHPEEQM